EAERCHRLAFIFRGEVLAVGTPAEVVEARGLSIVEVECDQTVRAADVLRTQPAVDEVTFLGEIVRVALRDCADPEGVIAGALGAARVSISHMRRGRANV